PGRQHVLRWLYSLHWKIETVHGGHSQLPAVAQGLASVPQPYLRRDCGSLIGDKAPPRGEGDIGLETIRAAAPVGQVEAIGSGLGKVALEQIDKLDARPRRDPHSADFERQAGLRRGVDLLPSMAF